MKKLLFMVGILFAMLIIAGCGSETVETSETTEESTEGTETEETAEVVVEQPVEEITPTEETDEEETSTEEVETPSEEVTAEETTNDDEETAETAAEETIVEESAEAAGYEGASTAGCTDSDGGKNYELAGNMIDARGVTDYDRCSENENFPQRLYESYCEADGNHGRETYDCPTGKCSAGACVAAEATE